jgi:hypothetical protein
VLKDVDVSKKSEWVGNLSAANTVSRLTTYQQEQLVDTPCDGSLKDISDVDKLPQFWLLVKNATPSLSDKALPFVTTYLGETAFSTVAVTKRKH